jgi:endonuclease/exonuclease/phosphatase family metal-dependent hydrolase
LAHRIDDLRHAGSSIILLIDANESTGKLGQLARWVQANKLMDAHARHHATSEAPATYSRGKHQIDYIFTSNDLSDFILRAGVMSFHNFVSSDHHPLFIDMHLSNYLGSQDVLPNEESRGINSYDPRACLVSLD